MALCLMCVFAGALGVDVAAAPATYYVSKSTGSDKRTCAQATSPATPRGTVMGGLSCVRAGDTLLVGEGVYPEQISNPAIAGTSWSNKVRIAAQPGEAVWLTPTSCKVTDAVVRLEGNQQYVEFDGINANAVNCGQYPTILIVGCNNGRSHHIRWQNAEWIEAYVGAYLVRHHRLVCGSNEFSNLRLHSGWDNDARAAPVSGWPAGDGFYIQSDDNVFDNVDISEWAGSASRPTTVTGTRTGNVFKNSKIHDITYSADCVRFVGALIANGSSGFQFFNNVIYNIGGGPGTIERGGQRLRREKHVDREQHDLRRGRQWYPGGSRPHGYRRPEQPELRE